MPDSYQFAVVRYVPNVVRDEAVNVGLVLRALDSKAFHFRFLKRSATVRKLWPDADQALVTHFEKQLTRAVKEDAPLGGIGHLAEPNFFERAQNEFNGNLQLTSARGLLTNAPAEEVLRELYQTYVADPSAGPRPINYQAIAPHRTREKLWRAFEREDLIGRNRLADKVVLKGRHAPWTFDLGYKNGAYNVINSVAINAPTAETNLGRALVLKGMFEEVQQVAKSDIRMRAVVESGKSEDVAGARPAKAILADAGIEVTEMSDLAELVEKVRVEVNS